MKVVQTNIYKSSHVVLDIDTITINECLVFDIYIKRDNNFVIVIEAGTILTDKLLQKLQKQNKLYINKEDQGKQKLSCRSLTTHILYNKENPKKSLELLSFINHKIFTDFQNSQEDKISLKCVNELLMSIIFLIKEQKKRLKDLMPYFLNKHELPTHSLNVSLYSLSLGVALKFNDKELLQLGVASLLHDIGIKKVDQSIIAKDNKLSLRELESIHQHPIYSTQIAKQNLVLDPYIIDAITHHHENHDGSGYPDSLDTRKISNYASIISIADVFDALTNTRPNREAYTSFDSLKIMMRDESMANKFNYAYLKKFLKLL